jgi:hypothetical protein
MSSRFFVTRKRPISDISVSIVNLSEASVSLSCFTILSALPANESKFCLRAETPMLWKPKVGGWSVRKISALVARAFRQGVVDNQCHEKILESLE